MKHALIANRLISKLKHSNTQQLVLTHTKPTPPHFSASERWHSSIHNNIAQCPTLSHQQQPPPTQRTISCRITPPSWVSISIKNTHTTTITQTTHKSLLIQLSGEWSELNQPARRDTFLNSAQSSITGWSVQTRVAGTFGVQYNF